MKDLTKHAKKGRRILNDNIRRDYMKLLEMLTKGSECDGDELEALAGKYRFYFDEFGDIHELNTKVGR